jgi:SAM-dependent methyltransferase
MEGKPKMRILNAGSGNDTYGTDFIDLYPGNPGVLKCNLDVDRFPYADNTFDEVYSQCVFEHLIDRSNFMKECHRVLKPNGKLVIITDNAAYLGFHIFGVAMDHKYISLYGDKDTHYSLFTPYHLKNFAKRYGFENDSVTYPSQIRGQCGVAGKTWLLKWFAHKTGFCEKLLMVNIKLEATKRPDVN